MQYNSIQFQQLAAGAAIRLEFNKFLAKFRALRLRAAHLLIKKKSPPQAPRKFFWPFATLPFHAYVLPYASTTNPIQPSTHLNP